MPLLGIPNRITPEVLYALARAGHGDKIVIADANFPSDSIAAHSTLKTPLRVQGSTADVLKDILTLLPLDQYVKHPVAVMDRVPSDKLAGLHVPAYAAIASTSAMPESELRYVERFEFYEEAKSAFVIIQTDDRTLYANVIIQKGVI
jgi:L-fucose mutarotase